MNPANKNSAAALWTILILCGTLVPSAIARVESELASPDKRKVSVEKAASLAKEAAVDALAPETPNPFAPPGFELTDAEEAAAAAAAARQAAATSGGTSGVVMALSDRQILEAIVSKIVPSGSINLGGKPLLLFGKKFVRTGSHFTVTYKGSDYDLELTDIDASTFTLRYNHEEITRPIKPGKSP
jgi:hypothetical protein